MTKRGRPTDAPKTDRVTVRLNPTDMKLLQTHCNKYEVSRAEAVRRAITVLTEQDIKIEETALSDQESSHFLRTRNNT